MTSSLPGNNAPISPNENTGKNNPLFSLLKTVVGTAKGWIRVLREHPLPNLAHVGYCSRCERPKISGPLPAAFDFTCSVCREKILEFDEKFYFELSEFLRQSYARDKGLFASVKAEFPSWPFPKLEGPLAWLKAAYDEAPNPQGRPRDTVMHLFLASWIRSLSAPLVVFHFTAEGIPYTRKIKKIMPQADAVELLQGNIPSEKLPLYTPMRRIRKFGGLTNDELRQIYERFESEALKQFGSIPSVDPREVQRLMRWRRDLQYAEHRMQGSKIKEK